MDAEVTVEREIDRLDLNTAAPELLFAIFGANGFEEERARSMAARILDWRDADDTPSEGGADGLPYGPRNGPFEAPEELRQVLGSEAIDATLLNAFTVYTHTLAPAGSSGIEPIRRALAFANDQQLGGRRWLSPAEEAGESVSPESNRSLIGEVIRVRACVRSYELPICREAVVRLTGSANNALQVFAWRTLPRL